MNPSSTPLPPGPTPRELLPQIRAIQQDAPSFLLRLSQQYGKLAFLKVGSLPVYVVNHPDGVKQVLQDEHRRYSKETIQYRSLATITGNGLLTSDGEFWLRQRRLSQGAFARPRLMNLDQIVVPATANMLDHWQQAARSGQVLDIDNEMMRVALEIVGKALFSIDLSREAARLTGAVLTALDHIIYRARNIIVPPAFLPTPRNLRFRSALRALDEAVYALIANRRKSGTAKDDLLDMFLNARDEETGQAMSDKQVRDEVITMLIAGHETVASALTWAWYLLAQNPQVRAQLHNESAALPCDRPLVTADLPNLPLAGQVFSEALRLYPPAWVITRKAVQDSEILGYSVPAGSLVIISPYVIHRLPEFWPVPETFDPGRFAARSTGHRFAYIPFGAGPRLCIGSQFATIEAQFILAMASKNFWLELPPSVQTHVDALVTLRPTGGLPMRIHAY